MTALAEALPVSDTTAITHLEQSPIFVVGHGSSGTSLLTVLLREHFGIAFGTESQFIIRYFRQLKRYGDLSRDTNLRKLIEHLLTERWFERSAKFGFRTNLDAILRRVRERTYSGVLYRS